MDIVKTPHSAIICGSTSCGKTHFVLELLQTSYKDHFEHIVIVCPTFEWNETYKSKKWIKKDPEIYICDPGEELHEKLRYYFDKFAGDHTLYIIDDCASKKALKTKQDTLSELAFTGRHANQYLWLLTQKYNAVSTDVREQTKWVVLYYCKDRDTFRDCLRENDVVPTCEHNDINDTLSRIKYSKLFIRTEHPVSYCLSKP